MRVSTVGRVLFAWVAMTTTFPAVLVLIDRRHASAEATTIPPPMRLECFRVPFVDHVTGRPRIVLAVAGAVTVLSVWGIYHVHYDYNLLNLQAPGTESVAWERRILASAGRSGVAALASGCSPLTSGVTVSSRDVASALDTGTRRPSPSSSGQG